MVVKSAPDTKVVMLMASTEEDDMPAGYLQKEADRERLPSSVRRGFHGELLVLIAVVRRVFAGIRDGGRPYLPKPLG